MTALEGAHLLRSYLFSLALYPRPVCTLIAAGPSSVPLDLLGRNAAVRNAAARACHEMLQRARSQRLLPSLVMFNSQHFVNLA